MPWPLIDGLIDARPKQTEQAVYHLGDTSRAIHHGLLVLSECNDGHYVEGTRSIRRRNHPPANDARARLALIVSILRFFGRCGGHISLT
jgi:hypothetical protein